MFLERAYCIVSPRGHGLSSDCLYDVTRELVQILKQNAESCKRQKQLLLVNEKNHGDLYILR